jgi:hypothetical protein
MTTRLCLTIIDKEIGKDFLKSRNKEVNIISLILLIEWFIFGVVLLAAYSAGRVSTKRVGLQFGG